MEEQEYLTIPEAMKELDAASQTIHTAMTEGRLPFIVKYGRRLVSRADLEAYKQRTRPDGEKPRGRPVGAKNKLRKDTAHGT